MKMSRSKQIGIVVLLAILSARSGISEQSKWRVQVGYAYQWGRGMSVSGSTPSISAGDLASAPLGGRVIHDGLPAATYPDNSLLISRTFDDGFVLLDRWTDDLALLGSDRYGMTWNWGVDNASQYNYDGGVNPTLSFHLSDHQAVTGSTAVSGQSDEDFSESGVEVRFGRTLVEWGGGVDAAWWDTPTTLDAAVGLAWFPEADQCVTRQAVRGVYNVTETYVYSDYYGSSAGGSWGPLDVPSTGSFDGPGALIPATPTSWSYALDQLGTARDQVGIESQLWHLRVTAGFALTKAITEHWSVYLMPQAILEIVSMSVTRHEALTYTDSQTGDTTTLASRTDHKKEYEVVPGFLLTGGLNYQIDAGWYAGASMGWEWLAEDPSLNVGSNRVSFDLDGGECSLYLGYLF